MRVPKGSITSEQWDEFSRYNKERAEAELKSSNRLREQIHHVLHQTENDLEAQKQATGFAFRKRIHECQQAKTELEWQKKNIEDQIAEMENDIRGLEEVIRNRNRSTMKAETRLENRTYRPNIELCCDAAHYGLVDEVKQLHATTKALKEKLTQAQHAVDGLHRNLNRLNDDIALKNQTLRLDKQCMDIRLKLNSPVKNETENNIIITGMERMKSAILA